MYFLVFSQIIYIYHQQQDIINKFPSCRYELLLNRNCQKIPCLIINSLIGCLDEALQKGPHYVNHVKNSLIKLQYVNYKKRRYKNTVHKTVK